MITPVIATGPDDEQIRLARWYKPDGARIKIGERICELESEMAAVDLVASESGILRHLKREGDPVRPGESVARIESE
jgi:pyruvate/2-oxoglutarate dehydrogenase complex dihydrolipoamide acyltransferase (E2) component